MPSTREKSHVYRSIARALKRVVNEHCANTEDTEDDVADACSITKGYLNNQLNEYAPVCADVLVRVTRATGNLHAMETLAHLCSCSLIAYPVGNGSDINMGTAIREFGEFVVEYEKDKQDGRVTPDELERIEAEARQAMQAIQTVLADAREQAKAVKQPQGKMAI